MQHFSTHAGDISLATVEGIALFVLRGEGVVPAPRPRWLPAGVPWTRTTTGEVFSGLQLRADGVLRPMAPEMATMLPQQWQLLLAQAETDLPEGAVLRSGVLTTGPDTAFVDYDADLMQWVGAWTVGREQRVGLRRATWTIQAHPRRHERLRGVQRAHIPLRTLRIAS